jgi:hypothetical protein
MGMIYNLVTEEVEPEIVCQNWSSMLNYFEPQLKHSPLIDLGGYDNRNWSSLNTYTALSCYKLPDNFPERPEDSGVSVDYQIDILYE